MTKTPNLRVSLAQISPAWLDRAATLAKVEKSIKQAAGEGSQLVVFGEALVPGYPFWPDLTGGAQFDSAVQKDLFAHYSSQAVDIDAGDLHGVCEVARENSCAVYLGCIERPADRGGQSLYASLVYITPGGQIGSVHRKLCPTYEERLVWSAGDGHGLQVHDLAGFRVGGLNCWENWMPLPRAALYAQGENVHVAVWPGSERNTADITRFIARESRSWVLSVSALMHADWIGDGMPHADMIKQSVSGWMTDGGSCIAGPDGQWLLEPQTQKEGVFSAELDLAAVRRERQNFDPAGHYARPDVTRLTVDRTRQNTVNFKD
ncbi:MAG: carbon-nitrogen hydrolase family protein [Xanthomonadales bacterium]|nr:carbon-nitrogen hydrolase family protein [Xanthomonadales bacterium]